MKKEWQQRTSLLMGDEKMERLHQARILIVGLGGVGGYAAEMLVRAGVGHLTLLDADCVQESNINRQLCALHSTVGKNKVDVLVARYQDINPSISLDARIEFLEEQAVASLLEEGSFDFIVDAIDTIAPKTALIIEALKRKIPIVSSMGAGAKTDITKVEFADIWDTYHCGLSKAVRTRLKKAHLKRPVPVVFCSQQADRDAIVLVENERNKKSTTGTVGYMPAVFGCYLAQYVITRI